MAAYDILRPQEFLVEANDRVGRGDENDSSDEQGD